MFAELDAIQPDDAVDEGRVERQEVAEATLEIDDEGSRPG
jgi:hypothetical protein